MKRQTRLKNQTHKLNRKQIQERAGKALQTLVASGIELVTRWVFAGKLNEAAQVILGSMVTVIAAASHLADREAARKSYAAALRAAYWYGYYKGEYPATAVQSAETPTGEESGHVSSDSV